MDDSGLGSLAAEVTMAFSRANAQECRRLVEVLVGACSAEAPAVLRRVRDAASEMSLISEALGVPRVFADPPKFVLQLTYAYLVVEDLLCRVARLNKFHSQTVLRVGWPTIAEHREGAALDHRPPSSQLSAFLVRRTAAWRKRVQLIQLLAPLERNVPPVGDMFRLQMVNLTALDSRLWVLGQEMVQIGQSWPRLRLLDIVAVGDKTEIETGLAGLGALESLEQLTFEVYGRVSLASVAKLASLTSLRLSGRFRADDIAPLAALKRLRTLEFHHSVPISSALELASSLASLRRLVLARGEWSPDESRLGRLSNLHLDSFTMHSAKLVDSDLQYLQGFLLTELNLSGCEPLPSSALARIGRMTTLRSLDLHECHVDGQALKHLSGLGLTELDVGCNPTVRDAHVAQLVRTIPTLRSLVLSGTCAKIEALPAAAAAVQIVSNIGCMLRRQRRWTPHCCNRTPMLNAVQDSAPT